MSWFPIPRNIPHAVVISSDKLKALQAEAAAAPDLLEALRDCVKWYGNRANDDFRNDDSLLPIDQQPPEIQRAMRAIAKATGDATSSV